MPTEKPRIATYTTEENIRKFRMVSAHNGMSMSKYLAKLIDDAVKQYEREHRELEEEHG